MPERTPKRTTTKAPFTLEAAREEVLAKITKAGAKGASPITATVKEPKRSLYGQALSELEAGQVVFADQSKAAAKYFLTEFAPTIDEARANVLATITTAAAAGTTSPISSKIKGQRLSLARQALADLEVQHLIYLDQSEKKPIYRLTEFAPTIESARAEILATINDTGAAGTASPIPAKLKGRKLSLARQALTDLESERVIFVDQSGKKPKYLLIEYAPSLSQVAAKLERVAAIKHPELMTDTQLRKTLTQPELTCASAAFEVLEAGRRLVRLTHGKFVVFAHGDSLRSVLGATASAPTEPEVAPAAGLSPEAIRASYESLVRLGGFPAVEISSLQGQARVPMPVLKEWLLQEHQAGRAVFTSGDWSLADETTRAGVVELRGDRYLAVELRD